MMSELVEGSAWMKPPVDGPAEGVIGAAAALVVFAVPAVPAGFAASVCVGVDDVPADEPPPPPAPEVPAPNAARSTVASLVASAFFRWTTQMLPVVAAPCGATSSLATSERMLAIRAGLGLRTISELLRPSTRICGAESAAAPAAPGTATWAPPPSLRRWIIGAMSAATAYLSGITSTSPAAGVSIAAMILPIRCRLSA
jgi:hypothetical protein